MAENSVTIALKLDTSHFDAGIARAKGAMGGIGVSGKGSNAPRQSANPLQGIEKINFGNLKASAKQESFLKRLLGVNEKTAAQGVALMKGNFSAANTMGVMEGVMGGAAGSLLVLVGLAAAVVIGISALQMALKPIMVILSAIGKVLGAALMPMSLVIVTLLQPLIILLMPLVRLMNLLFRPLRQALVSAMVKGGKALAGDPEAIISLLSDFILGQLTPITGPLIWVANVIKEFTGWDPIKAIQDALGTAAGVFASWRIIEVLQGALGAAAGVFADWKIIEKLQAALGAVTGIFADWKIIEIIKAALGFDKENKWDPVAAFKSILDFLLWSPFNPLSSLKLALDVANWGNWSPIKAMQDWWNSLMNPNTPSTGTANYGNITARGSNSGIAPSMQGILTPVDFLPNAPSPSNPNYRGQSLPDLAGEIMSKGISMVFNVSGNMDDKTAKYITSTIQRELATLLRSAPG